jgi:hypothetical protein
MSNPTPVIPVAAVLEIGRIPVEGRADEPFAMLLSFQTPSSCASRYWPCR